MPTTRLLPVVPSSSGAAFPPWVLGPRWRDEGLRQPGWLILPLRAFLGVTFVFAGLQKLANPAYLDPTSPTSVQAQTRIFRRTSPIAALLDLTAHHTVVVGILIAVGELAVGLGTLLGLWARVAGIGGALLSLTFLLTVSWNTTPYYYGSDIVFLFTWSVFIGFGAGGVLSVDGWLRDRARRDLRLPAPAAAVTLAAATVRQLCSAGGKCGLDGDGVCRRRSGCPTLPSGPSPRVRGELDRRTLLRGGQAAAVAAAAGGLLAAVTAAGGRLAGHPRASATPAGRRASSGAARGSGPAPTSSAGRRPGTTIAAASRVPVGQAVQFTDPASGRPAWVVHPSGRMYVAFSAICTHAGCTVGFDGASMQFVCPCHGATYDARTGQVTGGPAPSPLAGIPVHVSAGELQV